MTEIVTAEQLSQRLGMKAHPEGGRFAERHFEHAGKEHASSGAIYYHLDSHERSDFHQIDCGEYWCHVAGSQLELWVVSVDGTLEIKRLGVGDGCEPLAYVPSGSIFAARHLPEAPEGTLVCCITVPRFAYEGFRLLERDELEALCPEAKAFFA